MSSRSASGSSAAILRKTSSPSTAQPTSYPTSSKAAVRVSRSAAESSTMRTVFGLPMPPMVISHPPMNRTREDRTHKDRTPMDRTPAVAGRFYPGEPERLARDVAALMGTSAPPGSTGPEDRAVPALPALGLLAPHAGYVYSGAVAGATY